MWRRFVVVVVRRAKAKEWNNCASTEQTLSLGAIDAVDIVRRRAPPSRWFYESPEIIVASFVRRDRASLATFALASPSRHGSSSYTPSTRLAPELRATFCQYDASSASALHPYPANNICAANAAAFASPCFAFLSVSTYHLDAASSTQSLNFPFVTGSMSSSTANARISCVASCAKSPFSSSSLVVVVVVELPLSGRPRARSRCRLCCRA